jgi:rhamnosyl/mannosyltransferase
VQSLARAQSEQGVDVRVICVNHADEEGRDLTGIRFGATPTVQEQDGRVQVTRVGRRVSLARLDICKELAAFLGSLAQQRIDVIHLHTPNATMMLTLAWSQHPQPLVITHHSDIVRQRILRYALVPFERRVYSRAAAILSDSPTYAAGSALLQRYAERVKDLPLGLDLAPYLRPSDAALNHARDLRSRYGTPIWLAVGRLVYYKGLDVALRALAQVPGTLMAIGTGPLQEDLRRLAGELGVGGRTVWRGYANADELVGAYHAASALWFPSNARSEGFGLVQVEAMASGCPVINTAIPDSGVAWVSPHGESGLTTAVNDPAGLAGAARRLLSESGLRERLSTGARERACREFDYRVMGERSLDIYQQVLETTQRRQDRRRPRALAGALEK